METTYKVRIYAIDVYAGKTKTTYWVQWNVAGKRFKEKFATSALAESYRSKLLAAARDGIAFEVESGLPVTMRQAKTRASRVSWFDFACKYVDMKWPDASPGHRKSIADSLVVITAAALKEPDRSDRDLRAFRMLMRKSFNPNTRALVEADDKVRWLRKNSIDVHELGKPDVLRKLLTSLDKKLDGKRAASDTIRLRRTTLTNALDYAVDEEHLSQNPMSAIKVKKHSAVLRQVDRRSVVNMMQGRMLLVAVWLIAPHLLAFFALMYYAGLRPEEAANIRKDWLVLPSEGWGDINLEAARPEIGEEWTDSGTKHEERSLKHRDEGVTRTVPACPELTAILRWHISEYGVASDGRLFVGKRGSERLGSSTYGRIWAMARMAVFTPEVVDSPLAKRPYDCRHACLSHWLNAGVEPTRVAQWAGNSVSVLLRVYAKCMDGEEQQARAKVQRLMDPNVNVGMRSTW